MVKNSKNHKNRHLDWSAAKKYFDKHTTWRDDFAAGYIGGGGSLDNAAASTKTRLKKRWNDIQSGAARQSAAQRGGGTNCTGVTKDVPYSKKTGRSEARDDSCDTNFLIARYASATTILGFATARLKGWAAAIPGMFGVITTIKGANLVAAKSNSSVAAVKYIFTRVARVGGNGLVDGQVRIIFSLQSQ